MKITSFTRPSKREDELQSENFHMVEGKDGVLRCSCGQTLTKVDDETYECSSRALAFRVDDGSLIIDKFGNIMLKQQDHGGNDNG